LVLLACLALLLGGEGLLTFFLSRTVERDVVETLGSALEASDGAVERALALAWVQALTQELVTETYHRARQGVVPIPSGELEAPSAELRSGLDRLERSLALQGGPRADLGATELEQSLRREYDRLRSQTDRLLILSPIDPERAHQVLDHEIEPQVRERLGPLIENRRNVTEMDLRDRARGIADKSRTSARLVIAINLSSLLIGLGVVLSLLRSTGQKVEQLVEAAVAVGQGRLDTRVGFAARDDLGFLANTFNQMAEDLARTTVSRSHLQNLLESIPDALLILDEDFEVTRANQAARDLTGYGESTFHGKTLSSLCSTSSLGEITQTGLAPGQRVAIDTTLQTRYGLEIDVTLSISALDGQTTAADRYICIAHDISERKRSEARLRTLLADKDTLLREVHHRVKNNLQVVSSLLDLQSGSQASPALRLLLGESRNRIRCMALIHDQLCRTVTSGQVDMRLYLHELTHALAWSRGEASRIAIELVVNELALGLDQAVAVGLIVNELVSNALEHAFQDAGSGQILIRLQYPPEIGRCLLEVRDDGSGFQPTARPESSLGLTLVEALVRQLDGTFEISGSAGTTIRVTFPPSSEDSTHAG
jgi:PAS domain S-box-containing protein